MKRKIPHNGAPMKIGLMGPFGGGNLGDAAIQQAMIHHIRLAYPEAEIFGFSLFPEDTEARHGIPSFPIGRPAKQSWAKNRIDLRDRIAGRLRSNSSPFLQKLDRWIIRTPIEFGLVIRAFQNLKDFDLFIVSGGGQLDDYWGGTWSHPYTILKFAFLSRLRKAKIIFVSVGAGQIESNMSKRFIRWALSLASYRSYRDERSKKVVESIGFHNNDPVYPDLAHSLATNNLNLLPRKNFRPVVGINPMVYFHPELWPERDCSVYTEYIAKLANFIFWLMENQYSVLLFPGEAIHDRTAINDLLEIIFNSKFCNSQGQISAPPILTVDDLIDHLWTTDFVVASRFHGVLLAQLINKPVLALSYHPKIDVMMADVGQSHYCLPIDQFDVNDLKNRFVSLVLNCETVKEQLANRTQEYRAALEEQYDHIFRAV